MSVLIKVKLIMSIKTNGNDCAAEGKKYLVAEKPSNKNRDVVSPTLSLNWVADNRRDV